MCIVRSFREVSDGLLVALEKLSRSFQEVAYKKFFGSSVTKTVAQS